LEPWELTAREAVRDTVSRYAVSGDRFRLDELAACFTASGSLTVKGRSSAQGREAIVRMLGGGGGGTADRPADAPRRPGFFVRHFVTNLCFESVRPDRIESTAYFLVLTELGPDHWGRYRDVFVPAADGRWLLESRLAAVDAGAPGGWFTGPVGPPDGSAESG
jgi:hypothetical protein